MIPLRILRHFKTPMPRRRRPIGTYQTPLGRFMFLRKPFGLPMKTRARRVLFRHKVMRRVTLEGGCA